MAVFSQSPKAASGSETQAAYTARSSIRHVRLAAVLRVARSSSFAPKVILAPLLRVTYSARLTVERFPSWRLPPVNAHQRAVMPRLTCEAGLPSVAVE
jgi:hypothetical protein